MTNATLLLIDDDMNDIDLFHEALNEANIVNSVKYYVSPKEALSDISKEDFQVPLLIFLDIHMPEMNGLDALIEIRTNDAFKNTPIIMLSGSDNEKDIATAMERKANAFINKPITEDDLYKLISQLKIGVALTSEKSC